MYPRAYFASSIIENFSTDFTIAAHLSSGNCLAMYFDIFEFWILLSQGRTVLPFNDNWRFQGNDVSGKELNETVQLPHTWNALDTMSTDPEWHYRRGTGIYEKDFTPPENAGGQNLWLEFCKVNITLVLC